MNSRERNVLLECIKQLEMSLRTDALTGCGSRYHFEDQIQKLWELGASFCIAFIDIDGLKGCNDQFGHLEGDKYIQSVSDYLNDICEEKEEVFRLGGDEFLFLSRGSSAEDLKKRLEMLRVKYRKNTENMPYCCNFSYGCAEVKEAECKEIRDLLRIADQRMYQMKLQHNTI